MASLLERRRLRNQGYQELQLGQSLCLISQAVIRIIDDKARDYRINKMRMYAGVISSGPAVGMAAHSHKTKTDLPDLPMEEWKSRSFSADVESISPEGEVEYFSIHGHLFNRVGVWEIYDIGMHHSGLRLL